MARTPPTDPRWEESITVYRRAVHTPREGWGEYWRRHPAPLSEFAVSWDGAIEDQDHTLQADFANKYIGGGALTRGCVQEEIRFAVCPELFVSMLLCEVMEPHEAIVITGAERFAEYTGYGRAFQWAGPAPAEHSRVHGGWPGRAPLDGAGRRDIQLTAFDAVHFRGPEGEQYRGEHVLRETVKAYAAFIGDHEELRGRERRPVATGNWGCGVFGGDPQLKSLIQWCAASASGRSVRYFCYGDKRLAGSETDFEGTIRMIRSHPKVKTVGDLYGLIADCTRTDGARCVFELVRRRLSRL